MQTYVLAQATEDACYTAFLAATSLISAITVQPTTADDKKAHKDYKQYFPHVQALLNFYEDYLVGRVRQLRLKLPLEFLVMLRWAIECVPLPRQWPRADRIGFVGESILYNMLCP